MRTPRPRDDRGVSLIVVALSMMFLLGAAAIAVDLASLRFDIRADRLASDAAATAGASAIDPFSGSNAVEACQIAWDYLLVNIEDEAGSPPPPDCTIFATACNPLSARVAPASAFPYTIEITHPVPDGHELMGAQALNFDVDGVACQRLGVTVERERDFTFAATFGFDSGTTEVRSVARIRPDVGEGDVVPLVVLEPYECDALTADGQGKITVTHFMDSPGVIVTDSDGSGAACGASKPYIIDVSANGNQRWIRALPVPGAAGARSAILAYALSGQPGSVPSRAYNLDDLTTEIDSTLVDPTDPPESYFQLYPEPTFRSQRVTRSPIDHRYNCKTTYPLYLGITISPCTDAAATYIDDHVGLYGEPIGVQPMGFTNRWTDIDPDCNVGSSEVIEVNGDWWVDCDSGLVINGGIVRFLDGNVVFDGTIDLRSDGVFVMNPSASDDYWAFFREGGTILKGAQSSITFNRTFVYLQDGFIDLVGGTGGLTWTAPTDETYPFEDLALWSESEDPHELGGQAGNTLTGTFFTPYANPFVLKGISGQLQTEAQFLTRRLFVTGFTEVLMRPDPETSTLIPIRGVALIR
ncbi:MAG TPA: hypothetical protein VGB33_07565 [Acidimicrobiia bacterium]